MILKWIALHSLRRSDLQGSLDACSASVHEYKIPPKALLGLHSYCPIHFDAFHAVMVDTSVHISLLKASYHTIRQKVPRFVRVPVLSLNICYSNFCITSLGYLHKIFEVFAKISR